MNTQEAIEIIERNKIKVSRVVETDSGEEVIQNKIEIVDYVPLEIVVNTIDKIVLKRVAVPKFVAEWIDTLDEHGLFGLNYDNVSKPVWDWVYENYNCNVKKLHLAYLYGYEVEKERLYTVEIPNPNDDESIIFCLGKDDETGKIVIDSIFEMEELKGAWKEDNDIYHLTEAEIKQDFEWAWQFAKEVE